MRQLCRKLLKTDRRHTQGPRYFLGAETSAVDRAYWEPFRVKWIDRQLHEVLRVEVRRVLGKGGGAGMLDALVDRQDRDVARTG